MTEVVGLSITPIELSLRIYMVDISDSGFVPNQTVCWRLRGEDPASEDFISAPSGGGVVGPDGMVFFTDSAIWANLNEDWWGQDEIFADVYYTYVGASHHRSNTIKRNFWIRIAAAMTGRSMLECPNPCVG